MINYCFWEEEKLFSVYFCGFLMKGIEFKIKHKGKDDWRKKVPPKSIFFKCVYTLYNERETVFVERETVFVWFLV